MRIWTNASAPRFFEISETMAADLARNIEFVTQGADVQVLCQDSYDFLLDAPVPNQRSLILIDPPYEPYDLYLAWSLYLVKYLHEHWPSCSMIFWYPCLDPQQTHGLYHHALSLGIEILAAEFQVSTADQVALEKSGLLLVNPPSRCQERLKDLLLKLSERMREGRQASGIVDASLFWLHERAQKEAWAFNNLATKQLQTTQPLFFCQNMLKSLGVFGLWGVGRTIGWLISQSGPCSAVWRIGKLTASRWPLIDLWEKMKIIQI